MNNPKTQLKENHKEVLEGITVAQAISFPAIIAYPLALFDILYTYNHSTQLLREKS